VAPWPAITTLDWLSRHRQRFGGGVGYAKDPVCGMQVERQHAPGTAEHDGQRYYFCSAHCRDRFTADPQHHGTGARSSEASRP
jgi:YHS domain-containing protein